MRWLAVAMMLAGCGSNEEPPAADPPATAPEIEAEEIEAEAPPPDWIDVDHASIAARLRDHPSRYLLVNVWSTWCEPCVEEMPAVISTARRYEDRGLGLVLIAADAPSQRDAAHAVLAAQGAPMPSWFKTGSDDAFIRALHADWSGGLPATLLLDEERHVVQLWEEPVTADALREPIETLIGGDRG